MDDHIKHKYWNPRLIELTQIGCPDIDDGQPTPCFVDPRNIGQISRGLGGQIRPGTTEMVNPPIVCTYVNMGPMGYLHVIESPQEVALRRDRALELPVGLKQVE